MFSITTTLSTLWRKRDMVLIWTIVGLIVLYLATRLYHLTSLPIFSDEGIYINWARIAAGDPNWRFISLTDGKQPLQTWGTIPFIKLFPDDLLLAGRLFSVVSGLFGLAGMMATAGYLWGKRASVIAGCLYIFTPYFLFYDRLALVDSAVNASVIWTFLGSILLARRQNITTVIICGLIMGTGLLAKSSVLMFMALSVFAFFFLVDMYAWRTVVRQLIHHKIKLLDFGFLYGMSCVIALCLYLTQRFFSPFFHYIAEKNLTFVLSLSEWRQNPFQLWGNNLKIVPLYVAWESGWIVALLGIIGIAILVYKRQTVGIYLLAWTVLPLLFVLSFNKVVFPRYLIFFAGLLTIAASYCLAQVRTTYSRFVIGATLVTLIALCLPQWFAVSSISLPPIDRGQYIEGKTAVWGAQDLMEKVRVASQSSDKAIVLAEGNFGLIADVLQTFIRPADHIEIRGIWPLNEQDIQKAQIDAASYPVFVVFPHRTDFPVHWEQELIERVAVYEKPNSSPDKVYLYRVKPPRVYMQPGLGSPHASPPSAL